MANYLRSLGPLVDRVTRKPSLHVCSSAFAHEFRDDKASDDFPFIVYRILSIEREEESEEFYLRSAAASSKTFKINKQFYLILLFIKLDSLPILITKVSMLAFRLKNYFEGLFWDLFDFSKSFLVEREGLRKFFRLPTKNCDIYLPKRRSESPRGGSGAGVFNICCISGSVVSTPLDIWQG